MSDCRPLIGDTDARPMAVQKQAIRHPQEVRVGAQETVPQTQARGDDAASDRSSAQFSCQTIQAFCVVIAFIPHLLEYGGLSFSPSLFCALYCAINLTSCIQLPNHITHSNITKLYTGLESSVMTLSWTFLALSVVWHDTCSACTCDKDCLISQRLRYCHHCNGGIAGRKRALNNCFVNGC